jgi:hypothetical protein
MSSGIWQRGKEEEGVYGFLIEDIRKEVNRASKLVRKIFIHEIEYHKYYQYLREVFSVSFCTRNL